MKIRAVAKHCKISRSTIYRLRREGRFPEPVSLTGRKAVAWKRSEIDEWIKSRRVVSLRNK